MKKALRKADVKIAGPVATRARGRAAAGGGLWPRIAPTIRGTASPSGGALIAAGRRVPGTFGAEYGADRNRRRRRRTPSGGETTYVGYRQFRNWSGAGQDAGYVLWPAVRAQLPFVEENYLEAISDSIAAAFDGG
ncbi:MAG: hypothetical protein ACRCZI_12230 [Cetobacterium sp.]